MHILYDYYHFEPEYLLLKYKKRWLNADELHFIDNDGWLVLKHSLTDCIRSIK